jgi:D-hydroxyproline dehydrogenase subunit beta
VAHAYIAAGRGHSVTLFERGPRAGGAAIRNFGMIWPIGQTAGEMHELALRSRGIWMETTKAAALPYRPDGSLHLAYREDEAEVLREFAEVAPAAGYTCEWLDASELLKRSGAVEPHGLRGGLWSATDLPSIPA